MFQFPACPPVRLWIHLTVTDSSSAGFPHSDINGSMPACRSPLLFAACHVLLRRMVPGHPPCALCSLIFSSLDPETNCFLSSNLLPVFQPSSRSVALPAPLPRLRSSSDSLRRFRVACNWPFLNLFAFAVQLSRCGSIR